MGHYTYDAETVTKKNIENAIGAVQVPLGVAGPVKINGEYAKGNFYIPLATTEGALVASVNRGCSVCTAAGGINAMVFQDEMTRAPVLTVSSLAQAKQIVEALRTPELMTEIRAVVATTTKHGELLRIDPYVVGKNLYLRFSYDTRDAMGMNMATIATRGGVEAARGEDRRHARLRLRQHVHRQEAGGHRRHRGSGQGRAGRVTIPRNIVVGEAHSHRRNGVRRPLPQEPGRFGDGALLRLQRPHGEHDRRHVHRHAGRTRPRWWRAAWA